MSTTTTDRIEKEIVLKAPLSLVWRAISSASKFGEWFHVDMSGAEFVPGNRVHARLTESGYTHLSLEMIIDRIVPEQLFSFHWHPYAIHPETDYSGEPMTLIKFALVEVESGTKVTVTESGFDDIPISRRAEAFAKNSEGWEIQLHNLEQFVALFM